MYSVLGLSLELTLKHSSYPKKKSLLVATHRRIGARARTHTYTHSLTLSLSALRLLGAFVSEYACSRHHAPMECYICLVVYWFFSLKHVCCSQSFNPSLFYCQSYSVVWGVFWFLVFLPTQLALVRYLSCFCLGL